MDSHDDKKIYDLRDKMFKRERKDRDILSGLRRSQDRLREIQCIADGGHYWSDEGTRLEDRMFSGIVETTYRICLVCHKEKIIKTE